MKRLAFIPFVSMLFLSVAPTIVSARAVALDLYNPHKYYGDEGKTFSDTASRCTGASFQNAHTAGLTQAKKDLTTAQAKYDKDQVQAAYDTYLKSLEVGWSAMQQPYCGFGAFGTTAALKSYNKTISDARTRFLADVKKAKTVAAAPAPTPAPTEVKTVSIALTNAADAKPVTAARKTLDFTGVEYGHHSDNVQAVQEVLIKTGDLASSLGTGYFGSLTRAAVISFQLREHVISSKTSPGAGLVGPKTSAALLKALE